ncbi:MAG: class I SAM-dependent methyltransferase [Desulfobacteraceae bacterium]|nr:class I SAM-dependent methyltransferase [Desulfobacteraceae bacterium]
MPRPDTEWNEFGKTDPYFGVITEEKFKGQTLNEKTLNDFFQTGERYIELIMKEIQDHIYPNFYPKQGIDFGCGVGRLVLPLAKYCNFVFGADVSQPMLKEARENCQKFGVHNVKFVEDICELRDSNERFDMIHSYNVFQHISPRKGLSLAEVLLDLLTPDGIGILHFPFNCTSFIRTLFSMTMQRVPLAHNFWNLYKKRSWSYPHMQMNIYNLNAIFGILKAGGCDLCHSKFFQQGDYETVIIFFRKAK